MREVSCPNCFRKHETKIGEYHYTESGLPNVWLLGVEIFECDCGENFAFIPRPQELHKLIACDLLTQENRLSGPEIRFLRKTMGLKAKDFASLLGVKNVTISRWERSEVSPTEPTDRFIRLFYAANMDLPEVAEELAKNTFRKPKKKQVQIIRFPIDRLNRDACVTP
ncbi:MAG: type II TA system antitoxin MqsA family protein [Thermodesulfobacteriota bacterium]